MAMTPAKVAKIMALVEAYADSTHISSHENCLAARAAVEAALRDAPQAEPTEAQIDAYCEAWGAAFEAEEPEAFGVTVEPLSASLRRCIVAGLRAAISAPTAVEPDERAEFEAWIPTLDAIPDLERDEDGYYQSWDMQRAWAGWQARASKGTP